MAKPAKAGSLIRIQIAWATDHAQQQTAILVHENVPMFNVSALDDVLNKYDRIKWWAWTAVVAMLFFPARFDCNVPKRFREVRLEFKTKELSPIHILRFLRTYGM